MLVDTHCHLGDERFRGDLEQVVLRARQAGVTHCVVVGDGLESSREAAAIAAAFSLSATAGVHPHRASEWDADTDAGLRLLHADPLVRAVGEAGLDYHYDFAPRDVQRQVFERQLALAEELGKPVVVHSREADADMATMVGGTRASVVMHSYSSGPELLDAALGAGAWVSFSGMVTFRSWRNDEMIRRVPRDRLLLETDSPYLAPVPHRGHRNEPAFVTEVARHVAGVLGLEFDTLCELTTANARACFGLAAGDTSPEDSA